MVEEPIRATTTSLLKKKKKLRVKKTFCHTMKHQRYVTVYNETSYLFYQELPRELR